MRLHQALKRIDEATVSRNVSKNSDAVSAPAQHRPDTLITAPRSPASASPIKSQFFLPMAVGRMAFSTRLLSSLHPPVLQINVQCLPLAQGVINGNTQDALRQD